MIRRILPLLGCSIASIAAAGPPYVSDDPEPTEFRHYEIYLFGSGERHADGATGAVGIDFNYGATPNLQLTAVAPVAYEHPDENRSVAGLGNIELAAKYRFVHQQHSGWDVAFFPRLFLPSASARVGEQHAAMLLPMWLEKDFGHWSTFGGGGCLISRGDGSQDSCMAGWALTRQLGTALQIGAELVHQTPDTRDGHASTGVGAGLRYDASSHYHLLAYAGPGLQNTAETARYTWYASLLLTF